MTTGVPCCIRFRTGTTNAVLENGASRIPSGLVASMVFRTAVSACTAVLVVPPHLSWTPSFFASAVPPHSMVMKYGSAAAATTPPIFNVAAALPVPAYPGSMTPIPITPAITISRIMLVKGRFIILLQFVLDGVFSYPPVCSFLLTSNLLGLYDHATLDFPYHYAASLRPWSR